MVVLTIIEKTLQVNFFLITEMIDKFYLQTIFFAWAQSLLQLFLFFSLKNYDNK